MNFNVNKKTKKTKKNPAACDLSRHREEGGAEGRRGGGASRSEVQFIPTSEPRQLESGLQKGGGGEGDAAVTGKSCGVHMPADTHARPPAMSPAHQRLLTAVRFRNMGYCAIPRPSPEYGFPSFSVFHYPGFFRSAFFSTQSGTIRAGKPISAAVPSVPSSVRTCLFTNLRWNPRPRNSDVSRRR